MASDSSTPPALTPDATGSGDSSLIAPGASTTKSKPARRQVAFYPNTNSSNKSVKPFSRSAAKRQSVMTLGSIEHLQHYFTKTGLAARTASPSNSKLFVPAVGGLQLNTEVLDKVPEFELPPSPVIPEIRQPVFPPSVKTYETDPEAFLPRVIDDIDAVTQLWGIQGGRDTPGTAPDDTSATLLQGPIDVLNALKTTTRMVRSVRNYVMALPDESAETSRTQYRGRHNLVRRNISKQTDTLSMIRQSALEVLVTLRDLEERSRIPPTDDAYDAQSEHGSSQGQNPYSRVASPGATSDDDISFQSLDPDTSISFIQVQGRDESVPVWEAEPYQSRMLEDEEREKRPHWDDKLVFGGGWLYKQGVRLGDLGDERNVVQRYVNLVDDTIFGGTWEGKRGWERARERIARGKRDSKARRVSAGDVEWFRFPSVRSEAPRRVSSSGLLESLQGLSLLEEPGEMLPEESGDEDDLPGWAKQSSFADKPIERAHVLIQALIPDDLQPALPLCSDKIAFLRALSSGQLLCVALNTSIRRSRKPWGYISTDSIHDVIALEQPTEAGDKAKSGWAFRRIDNLSMWASALKHRYLLPLITPSRTDHLSPMLSPSHNLSPTRRPSGTLPTPSTPKLRPSPSEPSLHFDPSVVARGGDGWDGMLEAAVLQWVGAVVEEKRSERWS